MEARALLLVLTALFALPPGVADASGSGHHGRHQGAVFVHPSPAFVAARPVFVAPFRVHPRGFRHFAFVPVAPFPGAVFVDPFWWWNGATWVRIPGHWGW